MFEVIGMYMYLGLLQDELRTYLGLYEESMCKYVQK